MELLNTLMLKAAVSEPVMMLMTGSGAGSGIGGLSDNIVTNWIGPIFILMVAFFAVKFIKDRSWIQLLVFVGIAAVVGLLIFNASDLFGKSGSISGVAKTASDNIKY